MNRPGMNRRDFGRLTMAAFGGMVAGVGLGACGRDEPAGPPGAEPGSPPEPDAVADAGGPQELLRESNVCRGLNTCQGRDPTGENDCAGMGSCHTAAASSCAGDNECRGEGGCGQIPGQNACKGQGECAVPLKPAVWERARAAFEEQMQAAGREFGPAPEPSG